MNIPLKDISNYHNFSSPKRITLSPRKSLNSKKPEGISKKCYSKDDLAIPRIKQVIIQAKEYLDKPAHPWKKDEKETLFFSHLTKALALSPTIDVKEEDLSSKLRLKLAFKVSSVTEKYGCFKTANDSYMFSKYGDKSLIFKDSSITKENNPSLGNGTFSSVYAVKPLVNQTGYPYVAKIPRDIEKSDLYEEYQFLSYLHQHIHSEGIIPLPLWVESKKSSIFPKGKEFFEMATNGIFLKSTVIAKYFATLAKAIRAIHEHDIVHQDIKLENMILLEKTSPCIIDWANALNFQDPDLQINPSGTPRYILLEDCFKIYDFIDKDCIDELVDLLKAKDIFAFAVSFLKFTLNDEKIFCYINGNEPPYIEFVIPSAKDLEERLQIIGFPKGAGQFVSRMLNTDYLSRPKAHEVHAFFEKLIT